MERSRLRASTGVRYAMLTPILEELVREERIEDTEVKYMGLFPNYCMNSFTFSGAAKRYSTF